jgi:hypothetical protein
VRKFNIGDEHGESWEKVGTLAGVEAEFKMMWIAEVSDLSHDDLSKIYDADRNQIDNIVTCGTQLAVRTKLPEKLAVKPVMGKFLTMRHALCGNPLLQFKTSGAVKPDHTIDWVKFPAYKPEFTDDKVSKFTHQRTGDMAEVNPVFNLTKSHAMVEPFDDYAAAMTMEPMEPFRIYKLFADGEGPNKIARINGNAKVLGAEVDRIHRDWFDKACAVSKVAVVNDEIKTAVLNTKKTVQKEATQKAKAAAKATFQKKNRAKTVKFD